jgi:uncharacterized protein YacL (UPF0231 family)
MAPNKFEENIKDKLENRTIQPSKEAWNTLQDRLDASTNNEKPRPIFWIGLAASIVGILFVVSQFFNDSQINQSTPEIVVNPEVINKKSINPVVVEEIENKKDGTTKTQFKENTELNPKVKPVKKEQIQRELKTEIALNNKNSIKEDTIKTPRLNTEKLSFENQKIQDVVAQIQSLKDNNVTVTDADLELLLQKAQNEIKANKLYNEQTGIVDASLLLQDVEADLDRSFRDKVFKTLKENFNFITTAVANRNN